MFLVHDSNEGDHLKHLKIIFGNIREAGLKLKLSKLAFFKHNLQYLGNLISCKVIYPLKEKVASLVNLAPIDVTDTRHIIGLASLYRKFIANFSNIVRYLLMYTKKNTPFVWSPLCQVSFDTSILHCQITPFLFYQN